MMHDKYCHLFGPVPSRRFGRSLGVDLVPYKTCTLDCIFCQLGRTREKTTRRKAYVPMEKVLAEIKDWLKTGNIADYITLSGSGEPTLHTEFGNALAFVKQCPIPSVLLTNGTLLHLPKVRAAAMLADVVKISLSTWDQETFEKINRPHPDLRFGRMIEGYETFRRRFNGKLWVEVFLLADINSLPMEVEKIAAHLRKICPDRIQLNTVVRPPAEKYAKPLSEKHMRSLSGLFHPHAEIIVSKGFQETTPNFQASRDTILSMLKRRPCTISQIAGAFDMHENEVSKYLGSLLEAQRIKAICNVRDNVYYTGRV